MVSQAGWPDWSNFRPLGDCFLWVFFEIFLKKHIFWATDQHEKKLCFDYDKNCAWATLWAVYKQTHLVTLFSSQGPVAGFS
jgi:hypothetical protein